MNIKLEEKLILKDHNTYIATISNENQPKDNLESVDCVSTSQLQVSNAISQEDFIKLYNRLFFSKKYIEAFFLCLNAIHTPLLNSTALKKGKELLPFLCKKGEIHTPTNVDIDFIISLLSDSGYKNLYIQKENLLTLPFMKISIENDKIVVTLDIILYVLVILSIPGYPLFPIFFPIFMVSLIKRRRIIKLIGNALLTRTQNE